MLPQEDAAFARWDEPTRSCLLALRQLVLDADPLVNATVKYGMPCYCYGKTAFCYLWTDKKTNDPYILFVEGRHLDHPVLEAGDRARMKIMRVDPRKDIPVERVRTVLQAALDLYRQGIVKARTR